MAKAGPWGTGAAAAAAARDLDNLDVARVRNTRPVIHGNWTYAGGRATLTTVPTRLMLKARDS